MSSTTASPREDARYFRVRARLAGTAPRYGQGRPQFSSLLLPLAAVLLVAAWLLWGLDRWADAGLRQAAGRLPASTARARDIIGAWRGIADMLSDAPVLPEDDAISMMSTQDALDRFRWWVPVAPAAGPNTEPAPAVANKTLPDDPPSPGAALPKSAPVAAVALPKPEPPPRPPIQILAVPTLAAEQPVASVRDPAGPFTLTLTLAERKATVADDGVPPASVAPVPAPKRAVTPPPAKRAAERVKTPPRKAPAAPAAKSAGTEPLRWADSVRRQEAP